MEPQIKEFLDSFRPVRSTDPPLEKAKIWADVYQNAQSHYPEADKYQLSVVRRNARQNLRRLLTKYPYLMAALKKQTVTAAGVQAPDVESQEMCAHE